MRRVDSLASASKVLADSVLATHSTAGAIVLPPSAASTRSHQATSTPARASTAAITHFCATPWRDSQDARASSRSARTIGSVTAGRRGGPRRRPPDGGERGGGGRPPAGGAGGRGER